MRHGNVSLIEVLDSIANRPLHLEQNMTQNPVDPESTIDTADALAVLAGSASEDDIALTAYTRWSESLRATGHIREEYIPDFPTWMTEPRSVGYIEDERARREAAARADAEVIAPSEPF